MGHLWETVVTNGTYLQYTEKIRQCHFTDAAVARKRCLCKDCLKHSICSKWGRPDPKVKTSPQNTILVHPCSDVFRNSALKFWTYKNMSTWRFVPRFSGIIFLLDLPHFSRHTTQVWRLLSVKNKNDITSKLYVPQLYNDTAIFSDNRQTTELHKIIRNSPSIYRVDVL